MNPYAAPPPQRIGGAPNDGRWGPNGETSGNRWQNNTNNNNTRVNMHQQQGQPNNHYSNQWQNNQTINQSSQRSQSQQRPNRHNATMTPDPNSTYIPQATTKTQYAILYTHQKTKKKPTWKDGRLTLTSSKASLYDANPPPGSSDAPLDTLEMTRDQISQLKNGQCQDLESEKYKIQIEGEWRSSFALIGGSAMNSQPSMGMRKVMTNKFRVPKRMVPNFEERRRLKMEKENKRKRVLQPGELERMYSGDGGGSWENAGENWGNNDSFRGGNGFQSDSQNGRNLLNDGYNERFNQNGINHVAPTQNNQNGPYINGNQHFNQNNIVPGSSQINRDSQYNNGSHGFNQNATNEKARQSNQTNQYNDGNQRFNQYTMNARSNISNGQTTMGQRSFAQNKSGRSNFNHNARGVNQHDSNPSSRHKSGPMAFRSNGVDASGYYQEEEDEEDACGDFNEGNSSFNQQDGETMNQNNYENISRGENNEKNSDGYNYTSNENSTNLNCQQDVHQIETSADQDRSQNGNDQRVTDELLALLGATNEPPNNVNRTASNKPEQSNPTNDASNSTDITDNNRPNGNSSSFLADLEDAEDNIEDCEQPMQFDFNDQQFDSQDDNFDDESFNLDDDHVTDEIKNAKSDPMEETAQRDALKGTSEQQITPLSLPSAGESSSDDEDSLAE